MRAVWLLIAVAGIASCSRPAPAPPSVRPQPLTDRFDYPRSRYNRIYSNAAQMNFNDQPSAFLRECVEAIAARGRTDRRHPPRALDIGAGNGRNSVYLAEAGYAVTAIDVSPVGLAEVRRRGAERGHIIETIEGDAYGAEYAPESFDLIALVFMTLNDELAAKIPEALRPGGAIVIEGFTSAIEDGATLASRFEGWDILVDESFDGIPDWHWGDDRPRPMRRFHARKPQTH